MQLLLGIGVAAACVVVCVIVVGGGVVSVWVVIGGGVVSVWVVVGGGGGGGGVVAVCVLVTATVALGAAGLWWCARCLGFLSGLGVVAVMMVLVVDVLLAGGVAAALVLWVVELDDAAPQALTQRVSRTVASGMRRCLMVVNDAERSGLLPADLNRR